MEKKSKNTCENTEQTAESPVRALEIWARSMHKQQDLSRKAANAADLALTFWWAMTDEQRQKLSESDSIRYAITNLIGYGYSWSV